MGDWSVSPSVAWFGHPWDRLWGYLTLRPHQLFLVPAATGRSMRKVRNRCYWNDPIISVARVEMCYFSHSVHSVFGNSHYKLLGHGCANHATEGETLQSPIYCCDVTNPPYLFSGELWTSSLHCKHLFVYAVCCTRAVSASLCSVHVNETSYWRSWRQ